MASSYPIPSFKPDYCYYDVVTCLSQERYFLNKKIKKNMNTILNNYLNT